MPPPTSDREDREEPPPLIILPNRSVWVLPSGQAVDVETEGRTEDGSAFSHGVYVKKWISFRLDRFFPVPQEVELAKRIRTRARELLKIHPELAKESDEDGFPNPYNGDLAYNQAAEELADWIRIKPLHIPVEAVVFAETYTGKMSEAAEEAIRSVSEECGFTVQILTGGAIANRAFFRSPPILPGNEN